MRHKGLPSMDTACAASCGPKSDRCCSFSEQQLVDCVLNVLNGTDDCAKGGEPYNGFDEVILNKGKINTERQYPYTSGGGVATRVCRANRSLAVDINITAVANVSSSTEKAAAPFGNETALQYAVWQKGVIAVGIDASGDFQLYSQ